MVTLKLNGVLSWARAVYTEDGWKVNGRDSTGKTFDSEVLTQTVKNETVTWKVNTVCDTARFLTRGLVGKLRSKVWVTSKPINEKVTLKAKNEKLAQENETLASQLAALQAQLAELTAKISG